MCKDIAIKEVVDEFRTKLLSIHNALDEALGDTDPDCSDEMTDEEIRQQEPLLWAAMKVAELIGDGPWDKYFAEPAKPENKPC